MSLKCQTLPSPLKSFGARATCGIL